MGESSLTSAVAENSARLADVKVGADEKEKVSDKSGQGSLPATAVDTEETGSLPANAVSTEETGSLPAAEANTEKTGSLPGITEDQTRLWSQFEKEASQSGRLLASVCESSSEESIMLPNSIWCAPNPKWIAGDARLYEDDELYRPLYSCSPNIPESYGSKSETGRMMSFVYAMYAKQGAFEKSASLSEDDAKKLNNLCKYLAESSEAEREHMLHFGFPVCCAPVYKDTVLTSILSGTPRKDVEAYCKLRVEEAEKKFGTDAAYKILGWGSDNTDSDRARFDLLAKTMHLSSDEKIKRLAASERFGLKPTALLVPSVWAKVEGYVQLSTNLTDSVKHALQINVLTSDIGSLQQQIDRYDEKRNSEGGLTDKEELKLIQIKKELSGKQRELEELQRTAFTGLAYYVNATAGISSQMPAAVYSASKDLLQFGPSFNDLFILGYAAYTTLSGGGGGLAKPIAKSVWDKILPKLIQGSKALLNGLFIKGVFSRCYADAPEKLGSTGKSMYAFICSMIEMEQYKSFVSAAFGGSGFLGESAVVKKLKGFLKKTPMEENIFMSAAHKLFCDLGEAISEGGEDVSENMIKQVAEYYAEAEKKGVTGTVENMKGTINALIAAAKKSPEIFAETFRHTMEAHLLPFGWSMGKAVVWGQALGGYYNNRIVNQASERLTNAKNVRNPVLSKAVVSDINWHTNINSDATAEELSSMKFSDPMIQSHDEQRLAEALKNNTAQAVADAINTDEGPYATALRESLRNIRRSRAAKPNVVYLNIADYNAFCEKLSPADRAKLEGVLKNREATKTGELMVLSEEYNKACEALPDLRVHMAASLRSSIDSLTYRESCQKQINLLAEKLGDKPAIKRLTELSDQYYSELTKILHNSGIYDTQQEAADAAALCVEMVLSAVVQACKHPEDAVRLFNEYKAHTEVRAVPQDMLSAVASLTHGAEVSDEEMAGHMEHLGRVIRNARAAGKWKDGQPVDNPYSTRKVWLVRQLNEDKLDGTKYEDRTYFRVIPDTADDKCDPRVIYGSQRAAEAVAKSKGGVVEEVFVSDRKGVGLLKPQPNGSYLSQGCEIIPIVETERQRQAEGKLVLYQRITASVLAGDMSREEQTQLLTLLERYNQYQVYLRFKDPNYAHNLTAEELQAAHRAQEIRDNFKLLVGADLSKPDSLTDIQKQALRTILVDNAELAKATSQLRINFTNLDDVTIEKLFDDFNIDLSNLKDAGTSLSRLIEAVQPVSEDDKLTPRELKLLPLLLSDESFKSQISELGIDLDPSSKENPFRKLKPDATDKKLLTAVNYSKLSKFQARKLREYIGVTVSAGNSAFVSDGSVSMRDLISLIKFKRENPTKYNSFLSLVGLKADPLRDNDANAALEIFYKNEMTLLTNKGIRGADTLSGGKFTSALELTAEQKALLAQIGEIKYAEIGKLRPDAARAFKALVGVDLSATVSKGRTLADLAQLNIFGTGDLDKELEMLTGYGWDAKTNSFQYKPWIRHNKMSEAQQELFNRGSSGMLLSEFMRLYLGQDIPDGGIPIRLCLAELPKDKPSFGIFSWDETSRTIFIDKKVLEDKLGSFDNSKSKESFECMLRSALMYSYRLYGDDGGPMAGDPSKSLVLSGQGDQLAYIIDLFNDKDTLDKVSNFTGGKGYYGTAGTGGFDDVLPRILNTIKNNELEVGHKLHAIDDAEKMPFRLKVISGLLSNATIEQIYMDNRHKRKEYYITDPKTGQPELIKETHKDHGAEEAARRHFVNATEYNALLTASNIVDKYKAINTDPALFSYVQDYVKSHSWIQGYLDKHYPTATADRATTESNLINCVCFFCRRVMLDNGVEPKSLSDYQTMIETVTDYLTTANGFYCRLGVLPVVINMAVNNGKFVVNTWGEGADNLCINFSIWHTSDTEKANGKIVKDHLTSYLSTEMYEVLCDPVCVLLERGSSVDSFLVIVKNPDFNKLDPISGIVDSCKYAVITISELPILVGQQDPGKSSGLKNYVITTIYGVDNHDECLDRICGKGNTSVLYANKGTFKTMVAETCASSRSSDRRRATFSNADPRAVVNALSLASRSTAMIDRHFFTDDALRTEQKAQRASFNRAAVDTGVIDSKVNTTDYSGSLIRLNQTVLTESEQKAYDVLSANLSSESRKTAEQNKRGFVVACQNTLNSETTGALVDVGKPYADSYADSSKAFDATFGEDSKRCKAFFATALSLTGNNQQALLLTMKLYNVWKNGDGQAIPPLSKRSGWITKDQAKGMITTLLGNTDVDPSVHAACSNALLSIFMAADGDDIMLGKGPIGDCFSALNGVKDCCPVNSTLAGTMRGQTWDGDNVVRRLAGVSVRGTGTIAIEAQICKVAKEKRLTPAQTAAAILAGERIIQIAAKNNGVSVEALLSSSNASQLITEAAEQYSGDSVSSLMRNNSEVRTAIEAHGFGVEKVVSLQGAGSPTVNAESLSGAARNIKLITDTKALDQIRLKSENPLFGTNHAPVGTGVYFTPSASTVSSLAGMGLSCPERVNIQQVKDSDGTVASNYEGVVNGKQVFNFNVRNDGLVTLDKEHGFGDPAYFAAAALFAAEHGALKIRVPDATDEQLTALTQLGFRFVGRIALLDDSNAPDTDVNDPVSGSRTVAYLALGNGRAHLYQPGRTEVSHNSAAIDSACKRINASRATAKAKAETEKRLAELEAKSELNAEEAKELRVCRNRQTVLQRVRPGSDASNSATTVNGIPGVYYRSLVDGQYVLAKEASDITPNACVLLVKNPMPASVFDSIRAISKEKGEDDSSAYGYAVAYAQFMGYDGVMSEDGSSVTIFNAKQAVPLNEVGKVLKASGDNGNVQGYIILGPENNRSIYITGRGIFTTMIHETKHAVVDLIFSEAAKEDATDAMKNLAAELLEALDMPRDTDLSNIRNHERYTEIQEKAAEAFLDWVQRTDEIPAGYEALFSDIRRALAERINRGEDVGIDIHSCGPRLSKVFYALLSSPKKRFGLTPNDLKNIKTIANSTLKYWDGVKHKGVRLNQKGKGNLDDKTFDRIMLVRYRLSQLTVEELKRQGGLRYETAVALFGSEVADDIRYRDREHKIITTGGMNVAQANAFIRTLSGGIDPTRDGLAGAIMWTVNGKYIDAANSILNASQLQQIDAPDWAVGLHTKAELISKVKDKEINSKNFKWLFFAAKKDTLACLEARAATLRSRLSNDEDCTRITEELDYINDVLIPVTEGLTGEHSKGPSQQTEANKTSRDRLVEELVIINKVADADDVLEDENKTISSIAKNVMSCSQDKGITIEAKIEVCKAIFNTLGTAWRNRLKKEHPTAYNALNDGAALSKEDAAVVTRFLEAALMGTPVEKARTLLERVIESMDRGTEEFQQKQETLRKNTDDLRENMAAEAKRSEGKQPGAVGEVLSIVGINSLDMDRVIDYIFNGASNYNTKAQEFFRTRVERFMDAKNRQVNGRYKNIEDLMALHTITYQDLTVMKEIRAGGCTLSLPMDALMAVYAYCQGDYEQGKAGVWNTLKELMIRSGTKTDGNVSDADVDAMLQDCMRLIRTEADGKYLILADAIIKDYIDNYSRIASGMYEALGEKPERVDGMLPLFFSSDSENLSRLDAAKDQPKSTIGLTGSDLLASMRGENSQLRRRVIITKDNGICLNLALWNTMIRDIDKAEHACTFAPWLSQARQLLEGHTKDGNTLKFIIEKQKGESAVTRLYSYMNSIAGAKVDVDDVDTALNKAFSRFYQRRAQSALSWNVSPMTKQFTDGLGRALPYLSGPGPALDLFANLGKFFVGVVHRTDTKENPFIVEVNGLTSSQKKRLGSLLDSYAAVDVWKEIQGDEPFGDNYSKKKDAFMSLGMKLTQFGDRAVAYVVWKTVYDDQRDVQRFRAYKNLVERSTPETSLFEFSKMTAQELAEKGLSEETVKQIETLAQEKAVDAAIQVVNLTQQTTTSFNRDALSQSKNWAVKLFTQFSTNTVPVRGALFYDAPNLFRNKKEFRAAYMASTFVATSMLTQWLVMGNNIFKPEEWGLINNPLTRVVIQPMPIFGNALASELAYGFGGNGLVAPIADVIKGFDNWRKCDNAFSAESADLLFLHILPSVGYFVPELNMPYGACRRIRNTAITASNKDLLGATRVFLGGGMPRNTTWKPMHNRFLKKFLQGYGQR